MAKFFFKQSSLKHTPKTAPSPITNLALSTYQFPTNSLPTPTMVGFDRSFILLKQVILTLINKVLTIF